VYFYNEADFDDFVEEEPFDPDERRRTLRELIYDHLVQTEHAEHLARRLTLYDIHKDPTASSTVVMAMSRAKMRTYLSLPREDLIERVVENVVALGAALEPGEGFLTDREGIGVLWLFAPHPTSPSPADMNCYHSC
jgi:hypothetical protein